MSRGADVIEVDKHWKLFALAFGCVLIAIGVGWLKNDGSDEDGVGIRLG